MTYESNSLLTSAHLIVHQVLDSFGVANAVALRP